MDLLSLPSLFILLFVLFYLRFYVSPTNQNPNGGFRNYPLIGCLPEFLKNRHRFLEWTKEVLLKCPTNTAVFRRPGKVQGLITANPLNVEYMLKTNFENYPKGHRIISSLEDFLGEGIFNSDGHLWKVQRKTASYEFTTKSLRSFAMENVIVEIQTRLIPILEKAAEVDRVLDLQDLLERFAFDNVCKLAFNIDPACLDGDGTDGGEFMKAFEDAATISSERFRYVVPLLWRVKKFLNIGSEEKLKKSIASVHGYAEKIIRSRMDAKYEHDEDLLSRFIRQEENSAEFLRDIIISFILAGRDSTSSALTWFFWLLSSKPNIVENIRNELERIRKRTGKRLGDSYTLDDLREMNYLHGAISEALRLYPPVPIDTKTCRKDDVMPDGTSVRKDWFVTYHTYSMGRLESIWGKDCHEFRPERWLEDGGVRQESPFRFPVFHAGPRMCLGKDMAYIQMKSIAASLIERFQVDVQDREKCPEMLLSLTLRMKGGLHIRVRKDVPL